MIVSSWSFVSSGAWFAARTPVKISQMIFSTCLRVMSYDMSCCFFLWSLQHTEEDQLSNSTSFFFRKIDMKERRLEFRKNVVITHLLVTISTITWWDTDDSDQKFHLSALCRRVLDWRTEWTRRRRTNTTLDLEREGWARKENGEVTYYARRRTRKERIQEDWIHGRTDWIQRQFEI